jgi:thiamine biosynthesis lipoprotein
MQQHEFRAMGSRVLAILDSEEPQPILNQVPGWFEDWEQALSRFRIHSELSRLNANGGAPRSVSQILWEVLALGREAGQLSGGLVNPLILEDLVVAGYDRPFDLMQRELAFAPAFASPAHQVAGIDPLPPIESIIVDASSRTICLPSGTGLDFGGVAKGWAAHQAAQRLASAGPALVSAGGDVAVSGPRLGGEPWRIGVEDPSGADGYIEMLYIESGGVATSGKDHRHWKRGGLFHHHIIDPRTRQPAVTDILAATVVASTVMRAEALSKAVLIAGSRTAFALLHEHADAEGMLVLDDGSMLYSPKFENYL